MPIAAGAKGRDVTKLEMIVKPIYCSKERDIPIDCKTKKTYTIKHSQRHRLSKNNWILFLDNNL